MKQAISLPLAESIFSSARIGCIGPILMSRTATERYVRQPTHRTSKRTQGAGTGRYRDREPAWAQCTRRSDQRGDLKSSAGHAEARDEHQAVSCAIAHVNFAHRLVLPAAGPSCWRRRISGAGATVVAQSHSASNWNHSPKKRWQS